MIKTLKNIIFDIGNVLLKFDPNAKLESSVSPIKENIEMLEDLYKKYQVYAITDASLEQINFEKNHFNFYSKFKSVLTGAECNLEKNSPAIYQYFLEKNDLKAEETVFIDDNKENVDAAKKVGIYVIYFTNLDACKEELKSLGVAITHKN